MRVHAPRVVQDHVRDDRTPLRGLWVVFSKKIQNRPKSPQKTLRAWEICCARPWAKRARIFAFPIEALQPTFFFSFFHAFWRFPKGKHTFFFAFSGGGAPSFSRRAARAASAAQSSAPLRSCLSCLGTLRACTADWHRLAVSFLAEAGQDEVGCSRHHGARRFPKSVMTVDCGPLPERRGTPRPHTQCGSPRDHRRARVWATWASECRVLFLSTFSLAHSWCEVGERALHTCLCRATCIFEFFFFFFSQELAASLLTSTFENLKGEWAQVNAC